MSNQRTIYVPDIGDFDAVEVIEVLVKKGDEVDVEDSLVTLESDKASMEIPSPYSGNIVKVVVKLGDKVKQGDALAMITTIAATGVVQQETLATTKTPPPPAVEDNSSSIATPELVSADNNNDENKLDTTQHKDSELPAHASPNIRKLARELGVDLTNINGSGIKNRVLESDLKAYVKQIIQRGNNDNSAIPPLPKVDFAQFGQIETQPLNRINKLSKKHLTACWLNIPHVTQFDEADITTLDDFRLQQKAKGIKLTPLVFIMKALVQTLKMYPKFNSSLAGDELIIKKYYHLGIAVNTDNGLMVPVIRNVDKKTLRELADELAHTSELARAGKLSKDNLTGNTMTISSLGGIGGTQFTPIVNAPDVAILGVARAQIKPVWNGKAFEPKLILPLALSYDHRVIDGAQGAEFITKLSQSLTDIREILL